MEDDPEMAGVLYQGFEQDNLIPTVAPDGLHGLQLAHLREFRAIILDVMLPGMDGFAVARTLRTEGKRTPILLLTARDSVSDIIYGLDSGAEDYLVKPFRSWSWPRECGPLSAARSRWKNACTPVI